MEENERIEYKPMKWYKSEFAWLLISLGWQLFWFLLIGLLVLLEVFFFVGLVGTAYTTYFILKGIVYAWLINPYNAWKKRNK